MRGGGIVIGSFPKTQGTTPITGISFDFLTSRREAVGSDNWPGCMADDGVHYCCFGDGGGFSGSSGTSFGVSKLIGSYDNFTGHDRYGGTSGDYPSSIDGKSHGTPICLSDGTIYFWVTPQSGTNGFTSSTLYKSTNYCQTITAVSPQVQFTNSSHSIAYLGFVNFGQANVYGDGYVYVVACDISDTSNTTAFQDDLMLLRVAEADIETQGSYEWFTSSDPASPTWGSFSNRQAIYSVTNGMTAYGCKPCWVPGLNRICMPVEYGGASSDFKFYDAPHPWGPFTLFDTINNFGVGDPGSSMSGNMFQLQFMPGWFRNGGLDFTCTCSGDGSGSGDDSFNSVDGSFTTG